MFNRFLASSSKHLFSVLSFPQTNVFFFYSLEICFAVLSFLLHVDLKCLGSLFPADYERILNRHDDVFSVRVSFFLSLLTFLFAMFHSLLGLLVSRLISSPSPWRVIRDTAHSQIRKFREREEMRRREQFIDLKQERPCVASHQLQCSVSCCCLSKKKFLLHLFFFESRMYNVWSYKCTKSLSFVRPTNSILFMWIATSSVVLEDCFQVFACLLRRFYARVGGDDIFMFFLFLMFWRRVS